MLRLCLGIAAVILALSPGPLSYAKVIQGNTELIERSIAALWTNFVENGMQAADLATRPKPTCTYLFHPGTSP